MLMGCYPSKIWGLIIASQGNRQKWGFHLNTNGGMGYFSFKMRGWIHHDSSSEIPKGAMVKLHGLWFYESMVIWSSHHQEFQVTILRIFSTQILVIRLYEHWILTTTLYIKHCNVTWYKVLIGKITLKIADDHSTVWAQLPISSNNW
jgi:hypothetical protein